MKAGLRISPRMMLPTMVLVAVMVLSLRLGDIWTSVTTGSIFAAVPPVHAQSDKDKKSTNKKKKATAKEEKKEESGSVISAQERKRTKKELSAESRLYQQLAGRRDQLDKRSRELDDREALVVVAETRIDQKVAEMQSLRKQLEALVGQASGEQQQQITNLVKVYESMKPKDAAKIFEALEMRILLKVVQRMKPKNTAAVLAKMDPQSAKDITVALTRRDELPQLRKR